MHERPSSTKNIFSRPRENQMREFCHRICNVTVMIHADCEVLPVLSQKSLLLSVIFNLSSPSFGEYTFNYKQKLKGQYD